jgi:hypothetical protein
MPFRSLPPEQPANDSAEYVEVYHTDSTIAAQKVLDTLLVPEGVRAQLHDRKEGMFPGQGLPGGVFIAVDKEQEDKARELIAEAQENGFLEDDEGELL